LQIVVQYGTKDMMIDEFKTNGDELWNGQVVDANTKNKPAKPARRYTFIAVIAAIVTFFFVFGILMMYEPAICTHHHICRDIELVYVQGGTFTMGCTDDECYSDGRELPVHQVTISSFYISKYEITQAQWVAVMGNNPSSFKGGNLPVENVCWDDAQEFLSKLNLQTGKNYRLPTEAEWEYAARGGIKSQGYKYSGSNHIDDVAWYSDNSDGGTKPVGTKIPNELGIYDMSGNVWEWCNDWFGEYSSSPQHDPTGVSAGGVYVLRGGSWYFSAKICRIATRRYNAPGLRHSLFGFRVVHP
jgi:formylglycine-generating enzyme required for sulfatase activity